jgi:hypothetical protein
MGLAPQSIENELSLGRQSMFWPAVTSSWPAWPVEMPSSSTVRGAAVATSASSSRSSVVISWSWAWVRCAVERTANFAAWAGERSSRLEGRKRAQTVTLPRSVLRTES